MKLFFFRTFMLHRRKCRLLCLFVVITLLFTWLVFLWERKVKTRDIFKALGSRDTKELIDYDKDSTLLGSFPDFNSSKINLEKSSIACVMVTSAPKNYQQRQMIRKTWAKHKYQFQIPVLFFIGRPTDNSNYEILKSEAAQHLDIVVDDFQDSYYALTIKTLRILKWSLYHVKNFKFLVKTDDDVFINLRNLHEYLTSLNEEEFMGGFPRENSPAHTFNAFSKWYVPPGLWASILPYICSSHNQTADIFSSPFPPYLEGNFYVISYSLIPKLLEASIDLPMFHLEDVYLTGFVPCKLPNIKKVRIPHIFTSSAQFPWLHYIFSLHSASPDKIISYHCNNDINLIQLLYYQS